MYHNITMNPKITFSQIEIGRRCLEGDFDFYKITFPTTTTTKTTTYTTTKKITGENKEKECAKNGCKLFDDKEKLKLWRSNFKGIEIIDKKSNILLHGAIDNILVKGKKLIVLDYKTRGFPVKEDTHEHYVNYVFNGVIHKYYPDFLIKLKNGKILILEVKGRDDQKNKTKREYFKEWIDAVNSDGRFGAWEFDVSFRTADVKDIINKHAKS